MGPRAVAPGVRVLFNNAGLQKLTHMPRRPGFFAVMAALALAGCASPRDPDLRLPEAFEAPEGAPAGALALDTWWTAYDDAELTALIEQALARNPDIRTARARTSGANLFVVLLMIAPSSQELGPPAISGRFSPVEKGGSQW